jgi:hypothetical protein
VRDEQHSRAASGTHLPHQLKYAVGSLRVEIPGRFIRENQPRVQRRATTRNNGLQHVFVCDDKGGYLGPKQLLHGFVARARERRDDERRNEPVTLREIPPFDQISRVTSIQHPVAPQPLTASLGADHHDSVAVEGTAVVLRTPVPFIHPRHLAVYSSI